MVDIHCHMLPGIDDGAASWEVALQMADVAIRDGIQHVVCTPHANDKYPFDRRSHESLLDELRTRTGNKLKFSLGCDFHFSFENIQDALNDPDPFLIGSSDYLLVEFSDYSFPRATIETIQRFTSMGITPIITHPERNLLLQRSPEQLTRLREAGCLVQITANSLTGHWGEGPKRFCKSLLDEDAVQFVASDAHDPRFRPPILSAARELVEATWGTAMADALFVGNPLAVVQNQPLPYFSEPNHG
jgi:protein-tyrosine phosphatase